MKLSEIAKIVGGELIGDDATINGIKINSQKIESGDLFIPTLGTRDGHEFIEDAFSKGAVAAVTAKRPEVLQPGAKTTPSADAATQTTPSPIGATPSERRGISKRNYIYVGPEDLEQYPLGKTLEVLKLIAKNHYDNLVHKPKVFGITGSVGKTTTKDYLVELLRGNARVVYTAKNFNTPYSVPFTLLQVDETTECLVLELSATCYADMEFYNQMIELDYALITKIGIAHLQGFGSKDGLVKTKMHIFDMLKVDGIAFVNRNSDSGIPTEFPATGVTVVEFSTKELERVSSDDEGYYTYTYKGKVIELKIPSYPVMLDSFMAIKIAETYGVSLDSIVKTLENFSNISEHRMDLKTVSGVTIIDDSYNANPTSMKASIDFVMSTKKPGTRILLVLGEMAELGEGSEELHFEFAKYLENVQYDELLLVGEMNKVIAKQLEIPASAGMTKGNAGMTKQGAGMTKHDDAIGVAQPEIAASQAPRNDGSAGVKFFNSNAELFMYLKNNVSKGDKILFKGSNSNRLFEVAEHLEQCLEQKGNKE
jgi:UDP-N-acetylmuramoyl-tripeptide--D-alanyl-D-alanine ligase